MGGNQASKEASVHSILATGDEDKLKKLLRSKGVDVNEQDDDGMTALHHAAWEGNTGLLETLHRSGADFQARDLNEFSALHLACKAGKLEVAKELINEYGADVSVQALHGWTPLITLAMHGHEDMAAYMIKEVKADAHQKDEFGATALHWAARKGHLAIVKTLVEEAGADEQARDGEGNTALFLACRAGAPARGAALYLWRLTRQVHSNNVNRAGDSALMCAALGGDVAVLRAIAGRR
eukprot:CAMPEP_0206388408 /NCGR_PEP_ID=MMETSP0294-20121207/17252_1 /ASSEMBLY_ACC=CAM_ASM_000327 /TAXON_ID=39354 /ORGANISM="Heterosigma akashiwo, Strain CCMP2393" /LENGTH=237 /DNA_ID=CAMNT_0053840103 /DNA_START=68 /DNA_END=777 /DNA_ORIENTATION=-